MSSGKYGNISGAKDLSDWGRPVARFFANILTFLHFMTVYFPNLKINWTCYLIIKGNIFLTVFFGLIVFFYMI